MSNSRDEQKALTREHLLQSAKKQFATKGFAATSVRDINREIGMADGILYHYFPGGKSEILSVIIKEAYGKGFLKLNSLNSDVDNLPIAEAIDTIYAMGIEILTGEVDTMKIALRENDLLRPEDTLGLETAIQERIVWLTSFLEKRYKKGEIRLMDFTTAAQQLFVMAINNQIFKVLNITFMGNLANQEERQKFIKHILEMWSPVEINVKKE